VPVDSENMDFLYSRRHLATVRDGKWRELKYIVELDELEQVIWKTLDRIHKRDGIKIFKEVASRVIDSVTVSTTTERHAVIRRWGIKSSRLSGAATAHVSRAK
jgi:nucleoside-triphosphatase THEP1